MQHVEVSFQYWIQKLLLFNSIKLHYTVQTEGIYHRPWLMNCQQSENSTNSKEWSCLLLCNIISTKLLKAELKVISIIHMYLKLSKSLWVWRGALSWQRHSALCIVLFYVTRRVDAIRPPSRGGDLLVSKAPGDRRSCHHQYGDRGFQVTKRVGWNLQSLLHDVMLHYFYKIRNINLCNFW